MDEPDAGDRRAVVLDGHAFDPPGALELGEHALELGVPVPGEVRLDLFGGPHPQAVERAIHRAPRHLEV